jgi:hypothetical protein
LENNFPNIGNDSAVVAALPGVAVSLNLRQLALRLTNETVVTSSGGSSSTSTVSYAWDAADNRLSKTESVSPPLSALTLPSGNSTGRLISNPVENLHISRHLSERQCFRGLRVLCWNR